MINLKTLWNIESFLYIHIETNPITMHPKIENYLKNHPEFSEDDARYILGVRVKTVRWSYLSDIPEYANNGDVKTVWVLSEAIKRLDSYEDDYHILNEELDAIIAEINSR